MRETMLNNSVLLKSRMKQRMLNIALFGYAAAVGTALPVALSRCNASCTTCGACGAIVLGMAPLILAVVLRERARRFYASLKGIYSRLLKTKGI
jgi:hypothetical protein